MTIFFNVNPFLSKAIYDIYTSRQFFTRISQEIVQMYATNFHPQTFYHQYTTQFFPGSPDGQPRVGNIGGSRTLLARSEYTYSFRLTGIVLGCLILFFSLTLLSTEIGRVYRGSNNLGRNTSNTSHEYLMNPTNQVGMNETVQNRKVENRWIWPWSTPTLLFSLIFITAAIFGIISGQRENYSTILTFFIFSLLSMFLLIFLIASYSTTISGWKTIYGTSDGNAMPRHPRIDRDLSIVCLSLSCALFTIFVASTILSGISIDLCTRKDFNEEENDSYKANVGQ
ncbi:unnamed protein product [Rotaria socialis]